MDEKKIFQEMCNILKLYTKNPELLDTATKENHILNDLKVNSARLVDVVIKCEDVFGISGSFPCSMSRCMMSWYFIEHPSHRQQLGVLPQWKPMNRSPRVAPFRSSISRSSGTVLLMSSRVGGRPEASWAMNSETAP